MEMGELVATGAVVLALSLAACGCTLGQGVKYFVLPLDLQLV